MLYYIQKIYDLLFKSTGQDPESYNSITTETAQGVAIERGFGYRVQFQNQSLASGATDTYLLRTSNELVTLGLHTMVSIDLTVNTESLVLTTLYEGATITNVGNNTNITISNFNRNSSTTRTFTVKNAPTVTSNGTIVNAIMTSSQIAGIPSITYQLKPNTDYLFTFNNPSSIGCRYIASYTVFQLPNSLI